MKDKKKESKLGFQPIENGTRYTFKKGKKIKTIDVIKARKEKS